MQDLTRHFDPMAMVNPKTSADRMLILEELNSAIDDLMENLNGLDAALERLQRDMRLSEHIHRGGESHGPTKQTD